MGLIQTFALEEPELTEFDDVWAKYRTIAKEGFSASSVDVIGDLHAQMCMVLAHKEMQLGLKEATLDALNVKKQLTYAQIYFRLSQEETKITDKLKEQAATSHQDYIEQLERWLGMKGEYTVLKAEVAALETATGGLSRELSKRLK
jgi:hypothetical protein